MAPFNGEISGFSFGVNAYYFLGLLLLPISFFLAFSIHFHLNVYVKRILAILFCLVAWGVFSSFLNPFLFENISVFSPRLGIDTQVKFGPTALKWSFSNFGQALYLLINFNIVLIFLMLVRTKKEFLNVIMKSFKVVIPVMIVIVFWQVFAKIYGVYFPNDIIYSVNDRGWSNQTLNGLFRINGTMIEPSVLGGVMASLFICSIWLQQHSSSLIYMIYPIFIVLCIGFTLSTTGVLSLVILFLAVILKVAFRGIIHLKLQRNFLVLFILGVIPLSFLYFQFVELVTVFAQSTLVDKLNSGSLENRSVSNYHSLVVLKDTYGMGSGLGSNRPSSFIFAVLSNLGIIGFILSTVLFFSIMNAYFKLRKLDRDLDYTFLILVLFLLSMALAIPDLSTEYLWVCLVSFLVNANVSTNRIAHKNLENKKLSSIN